MFVFSIFTCQYFISYLYIFPLISLRDICTINRLNLILKMINRCDVKHMMLQIKTITSIVKVLSYIITSIQLILSECAAMLEIMFILTFTMDVIMCIILKPYLYQEKIQLSLYLNVYLRLLNNLLLKLFIDICTAKQHPLGFAN